MPLAIGRTSSFFSLGVLSVYTSVSECVCVYWSIDNPLEHRPKPMQMECVSLPLFAELQLNHKRKEKQSKKEKKTAGVHS